MVSTLPHKTPTIPTPPFLYRYVTTRQLLIQPLDIFGLSLRTVTHDSAISKNCGVVRIGSVIFLTGGTDEKGLPGRKFLSLTVDLESVTAALVPLEDMPAPKAFHGTTAVAGDDVVVIGGMIDGSRATAVCSRYSAKKKKWEGMCPLAKPLAFLAVDVLPSAGTEWLYTFGGSDPSTTAPISVAAVARYSTTKDQWETVTLSENQGWTGAVGEVCARLSQSRLLIFGGDTRMSYVYEAGNSTIRKAAAMSEGIKGGNELPICMESYAGRVYCVSQGRCHIYDFKNNQWNCMGFDSS